MAIHLSNTCANCSAFSTDKNQCQVHATQVSYQYTCDSFVMASHLKNSRNCTSCTKHSTSNCAQPQTASPSMLCSSWAPNQA